MDITGKKEEKQILEKIVAASEEFLQSAELNYQKISDTILDICVAKYAAFNLYDDDGSKFTTVAISAPQGIIKKASLILGFGLLDKKWGHAPAHAAKKRPDTLTRFLTLDELAKGMIPKHLIPLFEKVFNIGEMIFVKIQKEDTIIGDFSLAMAKDKEFKNENYVEIYARQVALHIMRCRSELRLIESEKGLKNIFAAVSDPLFIIDRETGAILDVNDSACIIYGYSRAEMFNLKAFDMSAEPEETRRTLDGAFGNLVPVRNHKKKDGTVFMVEITAGFFDLNGRSVLAASMRDITERKMAEKAIHESEEKYRSLFHQASDGIFYLSIDRKLSAVNKSFAKMHGYSQEEMLGMPLQNLDTPETARLTPERVRRVLAGEVIEFEVEHYHKDGHTIPLAVSAGLVFIEGDSMIAAFHQDITERKKAETALRENEIRFRSFVEQSPVAIGVFSLEGIVSYVNQKFIETLGLTSLEEMVGQPAFKYFAPQHIEESKERTRRRLEGLPVPNVYESVMVHADGSQFPAHLAVAPIHLPDGMASIAFLTDITERKQMEEAIAEKSNDLIKAYDATLQGWSNALELRERETAGHCLRVVQLTVELAKLMGIDSTEIIEIQRGALLHDIGKMGIPDSILLKPGPLSEDEWVVMRQHPIYAYNLLSNIAYLKKALEIPYCHHEKWDGSGYPRKLQGPDIPIAARIFSVIDVWDALSSDRPYRTAWTQESVISYLDEQKNKYFDPQIVDTFLELIKKNNPLEEPLPGNTVGLVTNKYFGAP